jgi:hypothetical protein
LGNPGNRPALNAAANASVRVASCAGFSDAGMTTSSTGCGGRRPRSAKARNRGRWAGWCSGRYGDLAAGSGLRRLERSGRRNRFCRESDGACRHRRVGWTLHDKIRCESAGNSGAPTRVRALPAESRRGWQVSLQLSSGGDGLMRCRSGLSAGQVWGDALAGSHARRSR